MKFTAYSGNNAIPHLQLDLFSLKFHEKKERGNSSNVRRYKRSFVFVFFFCVSLAGTTFAQTITFKGENVGLKKIFSEIKKQTSYVVFCNYEIISKAKPVTVHATETPLTDFLKQVLGNMEVEFLIEGKNIIIRRSAVAEVEASPLYTKGKVVDTSGAPLPGATVRVKSTGKVFITDSKGEFQIPLLTSGTVLEFSYISLQTQEMLVNKEQDYFTVQMKPEIFILADVAVVLNTGYQQLDKTRATGAFAKPDMKIVAKRTSTMDILSRLDGQVAGLTLQVGQTASNPDANGLSSRASVIRGLGSAILDSRPLYVVNGIIVSNFTSLNPDDIDDITVLKDAAATSVYGARAANGVIVITTKSGKRDNDLKINYTGFINLPGKINYNYQPAMNSRQLIETAKELFNPVLFPSNTLTYSSLAPHEKALYDQYDGLITDAEANRILDSLSGINNRKQMLALTQQTAFTNNHTISASAGNHVYSFYGSLGYTGSQQYGLGNSANSYKLNLTQAFQPNERMSFSINASFINDVSKANGLHLDYNPYGLPYQLLKDANGNNVSIPYAFGWSDSIRLDYQARSRINMNYTPLEETGYKLSSSNGMNINLTGNVDIKLWKGFAFNGKYGFVKSSTEKKFYLDNLSKDGRVNLLNFTIAPDVYSEPQYLIPVKGGLYTVGDNYIQNWTARNQLDYKKAIGFKHDVTISIGQEAQEVSSSERNYTVLGYDTKLGSYGAVDYATLTQGVSNTITGYGRLQPPLMVRKDVTRFSSLYALSNYSFLGKYSFDASVRQDKSNLFGKEVSKQSKPIWSFGAKWNISKENFFNNEGWANNLALRVTYGITGNSPYSGAAALYDILSAQPQSLYGGVAGDALWISQPSNTTLTWENAHTLNTGIDFSLLNQRINASIDLYSKRTTNLISGVTLNTLSGFSTTSGNLGEISNKGIEISLHSNNIVSANFNWNSNLVFSFNKNKLKSFGSDAFESNSGYDKLYASFLNGYPLSPMFAYVYGGLNASGNPQIQLADKTLTSDPFYNLLKDDIVYVGTLQPVFNGGFTNMFSSRGLSLVVNAVYNFGNVMRKDVNLFYTDRTNFYGDPFIGGNFQTYFLDRWKAPGDEAKTNIPKYIPTFDSYTERKTDYYRQADINVVSASFIKVRDITLSYDFPSAFIQRLKLEKFNVFVQAVNFMIWKNNHANIDPEFHDLNNGLRGTNVPGHGYSFGINLTF